MSKIIGLVAKSVDPDQTPHSAASDLGLHCLPDLSVPILRVNMNMFTNLGSIIIIIFFFFFFVSQRVTSIRF